MNIGRQIKQDTYIFAGHLSIEVVQQGPIGFSDLTMNNSLGYSILQCIRYHANVRGYIRSNPPEVCVCVPIRRRSGRVFSSSPVHFLWKLAEELHCQIRGLHINQSYSSFPTIFTKSLQGVVACTSKLLLQSGKSSQFLMIQ
jgi:hypothetical protein